MTCNEHTITDVNITRLTESNGRTNINDNKIICQDEDEPAAPLTKVPRQNV